MAMLTMPSHLAPPRSALPRPRWSGARGREALKSASGVDETRRAAATAAAGTGAAGAADEEGASLGHVNERGAGVVSCSGGDGTVVVLGASGRTGAEIVKYCVWRGRAVRACTRSGEFDAATLLAGPYSSPLAQLNLSSFIRYHSTHPSYTL